MSEAKLWIWALLGWEIYDQCRDGSLAQGYERLGVISWILVFAIVSIEPLSVGTLPRFSELRNRPSAVTDARSSALSRMLPRLLGPSGGFQPFLPVVRRWNSLMGNPQIPCISQTTRCYPIFSFLIQETH